MNQEVPPDITIKLHGNFHWFTEDDARAVAQRLEPHFRVESGTIHFYIPPGELLPPDVMIEIGNYVLARLDDLTLGVISSALYEAFRSFQQRSKRIDAEFDIKIMKGHGEREQHIHVRGRAYNLDTIKQLFERAVEASSRAFGDDD